MNDPFACAPIVNLWPRLWTPGSSYRLLIVMLSATYVHTCEPLTPPIGDLWSCYRRLIDELLTTYGHKLFRINACISKLAKRFYGLPSADVYLLWITDMHLITWGMWRVLSPTTRIFRAGSSIVDLVSAHDDSSSNVHSLTGKPLLRSAVHHRLWAVVG